MNTTRLPSLLLIASLCLLGAGCVLPWQRQQTSTVNAPMNPSAATQVIPVTIPESGFVTFVGEIRPGVSGSLRLTIDEDRVDGMYADTERQGWAWGEVDTSRLLFSVFLNQQEDEPFSVTGTWSADGRELQAQISSSSTQERTVILQRHLTEPIAFEARTYRNAWRPNEEEGCEARSIYPIAVGGANISNEVLEKMNQAIQTHIGLSSTTTLQQQGEAFMQECKNELLSMGAAQGTSTDMMMGAQRIYDQGARISYNQDHLVSLSFGISTYMGGAHGAFSVTALTMDTRTGDVLSFDDVIAPQHLVAFKRELDQRLLDGYGDVLYEEVTANIRTQLNGTDTTSSKNMVEFGKAENFNLTPVGLDVFYQQYEVAPYAIGIPEVFFTLEELKAYGYPETVR